MNIPSDIIDTILDASEISPLSFASIPYYPPTRTVQ
jgi:hypothetical protein